jgi:hypothetical protein
MLHIVKCHLGNKCASGVAHEVHYTVLYFRNVLRVTVILFTATRKVRPSFLPPFSRNIIMCISLYRTATKSDTSTALNLPKPSGPSRVSKQRPVLLVVRRCKALFKCRRLSMFYISKCGCHFMYYLYGRRYTYNIISWRVRVMLYHLGYNNSLLQFYSKRAVSPATLKRK